MTCFIALGFLGRGLNVIMHIVYMMEGSETADFGILFIVESILCAYFLCRLIKVDKVGLYGWLALTAVDYIIQLCVSDDFSCTEGLLAKKVLSVAVLCACLCLKNQGVSGWRALFGKED